jgi:hypothetical protein
MNKLSIAAAAIAGLAVGAFVKPADAQPQSTTSVINLHLTRWDQPDGGFQYGGRVCGYEVNAQGKRLGEPCWDVRLDSLDVNTAKALSQRP